MASDLPRLNGPVIVPNYKDGTRSLAWSIPKPYAPKLVSLLWDEAKVEAKLSEVDKTEFLLSATYPLSRADFVLFACLVFVEHYNKCRIIDSSFSRNTPTYAIEEPLATDDYSSYWST